jgi:LuxR family maltose regulon positive regulatory protein
MTFPRTKIQPPRPRAGSVVARPALEARLAQALLERPLVLVCAAAGYGKTSALSSLVGGRALGPGTAMAWIACDEGDELQRLLECLVAALEPYDLPWRTAPEALVAAAAGPAEAMRSVAGEFINTLDACDVPHGVIVFDDLHRVADPACFRFLDLLLERLSARWTLALSSRHEPPLALARMRARGEVAEFRQEDLRFVTDEVHALAASSGLPGDAAGALLERTQGWAAGLRLALSAQRGGAAAGQVAAIDRHVFEFLATEVLDRLEPELRDFLLRVSVLPELTAARCAAVTGNPRAAQWLDEIERRGLFVSVLDPAEPTLRLHDLFRGALDHRLAREHPQEVPALLERAADSEPDTARRIALLRRAGRLDAAADVLLQAAPALLTAGTAASVQHLLDEFPREFAAGSAPLLHVQGMLAWSRWDFSAMTHTMVRAQAAWAAAGNEERVRQAAGYQSIALNALGRTSESGDRLSRLRRETMGIETRVVVLVACLWHALDLGSLHRVGPLMAELMDTVERSSDLSLWYRAHPLPRVNGLPGTAGPLGRYVSGVLRLTDAQPSPLRAMALSQRGWAEAWAGRLDEAEATWRNVHDDAHWLGDPVNVTGSLQLLDAVMKALRGDRDAALASAQHCLDAHPPARGPWSLWGTRFYAARVAAAFGARDTLCEHLVQLEAQSPMPLTQTAVLLPLRAQALWLDGRRDEAVRLWRDAIADEARIDRLGHTVESRLRLAAACVALSRLDEAAQALAPVFERVADHAGLGPVLFARSVLPALAGAPWGGRLSVQDQATLGRWVELAENVAAASAPTPAARVRTAAAAGPASLSGMALALSAREREVLERIAAGDSNKLIARAFDLSPHTVKRHVANILDKLGAQTRGQAAAMYRAGSTALSLARGRGLG